jgi:hypothetical protein
MAEAAPVIMAITAVATTAYSTMQQARAASEARAIAAQNAAKAQAEAEETARRMEKEKKRELSLARARSAASGVGGLSADVFIEELEQTRNEEIDWVRRAGASQASIYQREGSREYNLGMANAVSGLASGAMKTYAWYQDYAT